MKLPSLLNYINSLVPRKLPTGMAEFEKFTDDVISLGLPTKDRDSVQWVISSAIQHSSKTKLSKQHFVQLINKSAANQVASQVFLDIKNRQLEKQKAEATANTEASDAKVSSN